jgi:hypothetical protein
MKIFQVFDKSDKYAILIVKVIPQILRWVMRGVLENATHACYRPAVRRRLGPGWIG